MDSSTLSRVRDLLRTAYVKDTWTEKRSEVDVPRGSWG